MHLDEGNEKGKEKKEWKGHHERAIIQREKKIDFDVSYISLSKYRLFDLYSL